MTLADDYYICTLCGFMVGTPEHHRDQGICRCCGRQTLEPVSKVVRDAPTVHHPGGGVVAGGRTHLP